MLVYVGVDGEKITGFSDCKFGECIEFDAPHDFIDNPFKYKYTNGQFVIDEVQQRILDNLVQSQEYQLFLDNTEWKVQRHRDQLELGITTSLTQEEYMELLRQRQEARDGIVNK